MPDVSYIPRDEPLDLGENSRGHQMLYGAFRVVLDDGFTCISPHAAYVGTVSVEPVDLDANPHFREMLIENAIRARGGA